MIVVFMFALVPVYVVILVLFVAKSPVKDVPITVNLYSAITLIQNFIFYTINTHIDSYVKLQHEVHH